MENILTIVNENTAYILIGMAGILFFLLILCIVLYMKQRELKKRYDFFMGANRRPDISLEEKLNEYLQEVCTVKEKYERLLNIVNDMNENMNFCIQKVGVVRYNPFEEMGGNLCFCVAMLDANDNGVVLNGIHSRTGSYTYAKPIELGVSTYVLSKEELEALEKAKSNTYIEESKKSTKTKKDIQTSVSLNEKEKRIDDLYKDSQKRKKIDIKDRQKHFYNQKALEDTSQAFIEAGQQEILKEAMKIVKSKVVS